MSINAEVTKTGSESSLSTIRKFSRRVQGTGLVRTVRGNRYHIREASKIVKKKRALKLIKRRSDFQKLVKEGKVAEPQPRFGRGAPRSGQSGQSGQSNQSANQSEGTMQSRPVESTQIPR